MKKIYLNYMNLSRNSKSGKGQASTFLPKILDMNSCLTVIVFLNILAFYIISSKSKERISNNNFLHIIQVILTFPYEFHRICVKSKQKYDVCMCKEIFYANELCHVFCLSVGQLEPLYEQSPDQIP